MISPLDMSSKTSTSSIGSVCSEPRKSGIKSFLILNRKISYSSLFIFSSVDRLSVKRPKYYLDTLSRDEGETILKRGKRFSRLILFLSLAPPNVDLGTGATNDTRLSISSISAVKGKTTL